MTFDHDGLRQMFEGDEEIFVEILGDFFESYNEMLSEIQTAISKKNSQEVQASAHTFKGVLSTFNALKSRELAFQLECAGKDGNLSGVEEKFSELKSEVDQLINELKSFDIQSKKAA